MALNKEIWLSSVVENLFPDNSFAVKSVDDSAFVNHKTVHVPNAGAPSGVVVNRAFSAKGGNAGTAQRTDTDLNYNIDELTTNPVHIEDIEKVELSYDKRNSVLANDKAQLQDAAAQNLLYKWFVGANAVSTTGSARTAHTPSATGNRAAITKADVMTVMTQFNKDDIPQDGRYLLLDAVMYADLMNSLTNNEYHAFVASADAQKGILGSLYGFNIMLRSKVLRVAGTSGNALKEWTSNGAAGDLAVGLAWQKDCVSRAIGEAKMFTAENTPEYYGDVYSFLLRTGGKYRRYDTKGVAPIFEVATT